jgi:hypothetical protein
MTSPNPPQVQQPGAPYIPGLITAGGTVQQPLPTAAQPGSVPGALSVQGQQSQLAPETGAPALPQAPDTATVATVPGGNIAVMPGVQPPVAPVLPTAVPGYPAAPAAAPPAVPGLNPPTVPGLTPPAGQPPAAPAAPAAPAQPSAPPAPASPDQPGTGGEDRGYPQGTPLEQMTTEQQTAYWKYHARQWEGRAKARDDYDSLKAKADQLDQLQAANASEQEKAVAAARQQGYQEAAARAAVVLVDAHVRAGLQQRLQPHQVEALAANLNHQHFLANDGMTVDAAKVTAFVDTVAPQPAAPAVTAPPAAPGALPTGVPGAVPAQPATGLPRQLPDLGQGAGNQAPIDKLEAGRVQARAFLSGQRR